MAKDSRICPYCGVYSTISLRSRTSFHDIFSCDKCEKMFLLIRDQRSGEFIDQYPKRTPTLDSSIPKEVAEDYIEAIKCFDIKAYKASVIMSRRALQSSVIQKGASKGRLVDQIDELQTKDSITKDIRDWSHEIRLTGNIGAHPDGLEGITHEDAEDLIKFVEEYLNYVYIMPAKVSAKRAKKRPIKKD